MSKKHISIFVIVVAVVVIAIFVAIGLGAHRAKAPESPMGNASGTVGTTGTSSSTASSTGSAASSTASSTMTVTMDRYYGNSSFAFSYPESWSIFSYSPFVMDSFGNAYLKNGLIPQGGAEIDIATTTAYGGVGNIMDTELMSATSLSTTTVTIAGTSCIRADYKNTYSDGTASRDVALYCSRGQELWKVYLSYRANDPSASTHIADFNTILGSMKFK